MCCLPPPYTIVIAMIPKFPAGSLAVVKLYAKTQTLSLTAFGPTPASPKRRLVACDKVDDLITMGLQKILERS